MRTFSRGTLVFAVLVYTILPAPAGAIPIVPDTFSDGTTMGWHVPGASPNPPTNVPTGGPAGAGDAYLQLRATGGGGPGSRLAALNDMQWMGDYLAAGMTSITMDVNNFGPDDLVLRLLFENFGPPMAPPTDLALTLAAVTVPANSGWVQVVFDLSPANVGALLGTVSGALGDVDVLRIFHNPDPTFPGPGVGIPLVNATLGVDNITAVVPIPEPGTMLLFSTGCAAIVFARRRMLRQRARQHSSSHAPSGVGLDRH